MADRPLLAFDTATDTGTVAVGSASTIRAEGSLRIAGGHSAALLPAIDAVLGWARTEREELGGIVVGSGPGSFTGLRIAAATAKSVARALDLPLFAYSSLLAAAADYREWPGPVVSLFDARRAEVFWAAYRFRTEGVEVLVEPTVGAVAALRGDVPDAEDALVLGPGADRYRNELRKSGAGWRVASVAEGPRASSLLWLTGQHCPGGLVAHPARWEPDYIRSSGAERIREAAGGA